MNNKMNYDFTTKVDRRGTGSAKWEAMFLKNPNVSPGVVPFSVADMELLNPPEIVAGLKNFMDHAVLGYTLPTISYKNAVTGFMKRRHGWEIEEDWIVQSPGVIPAFFVAVHAFTSPGDGVIIMPPVYYPFYMAANVNGRTLVNNPLIEQGGPYKIDFGDLEAKAKDPKNKLLIFCSPHNPVGRVWSKEELSSVADICNRNKVLVISDEIHFDILLPGAVHTIYSTLSEETAQNCIVCTAPSKTFNLAGMQVSNIIISNKELREKFANQLMKNGLVMLGILGQKACEIAYTQCDAWLDELIRLITVNRRVIADFMAKNLPMIRVFPLEGTYLQWLDFRPLGLDYKALEEFMVRDAEWFLDEGAVFGAEGQGFERINIACPTAVLKEALERLFKALKIRKLA
jgi:putative C-S lyase